MKIRYTNHGLDRIRGRKISKREIAEAMRSGRKSDAYDGLRKAIYANPKGTLIVIYSAKGQTEVEIITAYWA